MKRPGPCCGIRTYWAGMKRIDLTCFSNYAPSVLHGCLLGRYKPFPRDRRGQSLCLGFCVFVLVIAHAGPKGRSFCGADAAGTRANYAPSARPRRAVRPAGPVTGTMVQRSSVSDFAVLAFSLRDRPGPEAVPAAPEGMRPSKRGGARRRRRIADLRYPLNPPWSY